jgi:uncharacterized membrane protein (UPF0127 family)
MTAAMQDLNPTNRHQNPHQNPHESRRRSEFAARLAALVLLALFAPGAGIAQVAPLEDLANFPSGKLEIRDGKKVRHVFQVWLADSPQRQAQGLMFVRSLPELRGMLFVHTEPRSISMWMKNTYIPLDMVFIGPGGKIQQIVEQTTPHSLDTIRSKEPAVAVLEIAGGEARRLGIRAGQVVSHPALTAH